MSKINKLFIVIGILVLAVLSCGGPTPANPEARPPEQSSIQVAQKAEVNLDEPLSSGTSGGKSLAEDPTLLAEVASQLSAKVDAGSKADKAENEAEVSKIPSVCFETLFAEGDGDVVGYWFTNSSYTPVHTPGGIGKTNRFDWTVTAGSILRVKDHPDPEIGIYMDAGNVTYVRILGQNGNPGWIPANGYWCER